MRPRLTACSETGAVSVLFMILLPVLLLAGGLAIDVMALNAERRYVQVQADLAALAAARHMAGAAGARQAARQTVASNRVFEASPLADSDIVFGVLSGSDFIPAADQTTTRGADAVRVVVEAPAQMFLLDLFLTLDDRVVRREAVAAIERPRVSFSLGNCLAELSLLGSLLRPYLGVETDVLCSGRRVDTLVSLPGVLEASASLLTPTGEPFTYGDVLDAELSSGALLAVVTGLPRQLGLGPSVQLGQALRLPDSIRRLHIGAPIGAASIQKADLVFAIAELMAERVASLDVGLQLGGQQVGAVVRVGDSRQMVINAIPGSPEARATTAQIRVDLNPIRLLGVIDLNVSLRVASAEAVLSDQGDACATDPLAVVADFQPIDARLVDIDLSMRLTGLGGALVPLSVSADGMRDDRRTGFAFTRARYETEPRATFSPTEGVVANLLSVLGSLTLGVYGRDLPRLPLGGPLLGQQTALIEAGEGVLLDLLGLELARAELELLDLSCPSPNPWLVR